MGAVFVNERDWPLGLSLRGTKQSIARRIKARIATALRASQWLMSREVV